MAGPATTAGTDMQPFSRLSLSLNPNSSTDLKAHDLRCKAGVDGRTRTRRGSSRQKSVFKDSLAPATSAVPHAHPGRLAP